MQVSDLQCAAVALGGVAISFDDTRYIINIGMVLDYLVYIYLHVTATV